MHKSRNRRSRRASQVPQASRSLRQRHVRLGAIEQLEGRWLLSAATEVGIGAPVLAVFTDPNATAGATFTANSSNAHLTATVLQTAELLKMQVHALNAAGTAVVSGEMDFLLLDQYAKNNIAHIESLVTSGFYTGLPFHRVIAGFMSQGGDPTGTGSGGSGPNGTKGAVQDDEFDADIRYTTSGILALADSGPDTNDCQFFITAAPYRAGDYQYTIIGKMVAETNTIEEQLNSTPTSDGQTPVQKPIIDSVTLVTDTKYGLVLLKPSSAAANGETANVTITASDGTSSSITLTASDGTQASSLGVKMITDTPQSGISRPASFANLPDIHTTMNTASVPTPLPVVEAIQPSAGPALSYAAFLATGQNANLQISASGTGAGNGSLTITPSNNLMGVYDIFTYVYQTGTAPVFVGTTPQNRNPYDKQDLALYISPVAPTALSVTTAGLSDGGSTPFHNGLKFHVTGVTSGTTVGIFADNGTTPIGTATADASGAVDITTTVALTAGSHALVAKQWISYGQTTVGNRTIAAGNLYSNATANTIHLTITAPAPTATLDTSSVHELSAYAMFNVTYTAAGDAAIVRSTIDNSDIQVATGQGTINASLVSVSPNNDGSPLVATYRIDAPNGNWTTDLAVYVTVVDSQVKDSNGNFVAGNILGNFNLTAMSPLTTTVAKASGQTDPATAAPVHFTVTFARSVTGFAASDVTLGGTAAGTRSAAVTGSGATYDVAVSGMTGNGTVTVGIAAGLVQDSPGNPNVASNIASVNYTAELGATVNAPAATNSGTPAITVKVDDVPAIPNGTAVLLDVDLNNDGDFSDTVGGKSETGYATAQTSNGIATFTLPGAFAEGTYHLRARVSDTGGNSATSPVVTMVVDTHAPTVTLTAPAHTNNSKPPVTIAVAESGSGVADGATATLDVDLNGDGNFTDAGETGYATATVASGAATFTFNNAFPDGTYKLRARVSDRAGNEGASAVATMAVDTVAPGVTVALASGQKAATNAATINFSVALSEAIAGFGNADVVLGGAAGATTAAVTPADTTGKNYNVAVSGMASDGTVTLSVPAGKFQDAAGNANTASNSTGNSVVYDTTAPSVTLSAPPATPNQKPTITISISDAGSGVPNGATVTLDVDLNGDGNFTQGELGYGTATVNNGTATFTFGANLADGTYHLRAHVTDAAGNVGTSASATMVVSQDVPNVTVTIAAVTNNQTPTATVTVKKADGTAMPAGTVVHFDLKDPSGATTTLQQTATVQGDAGQATFTLPTLSAEGTYVLTARATSQTGLEGSGSATFLLDTTPPTVTLTAPTTNDATPPTITVAVTDAGSGVPDGTTVTFDVDLNGDGDFSDTVGGKSETGYTTAQLAGGSASFSISDTLAEGTYAIRAHVTDKAGNAGLGTANLVVDKTAPTVSVVPKGGATVTNSPANFTVTFSEAVTGFGSSGVTLSGTAGAATAVVTASPDDTTGKVYNVAVTGMTGPGTVILNVSAGAAKDLAGNASTAAPSSATLTYSPLSVTINQAAAQADPTNQSTVNFTVVFSDAVSDFATGDVTLSGTAGATTAVVTGSGATYNVAVSGMTHNGTVIASIAEGVATDGTANKNKNAASTSTDNSVTYDTIGPTVTIATPTTQANPTNGSPINFTVTFGDPVADFTSSDVSLSGTAGATTAVVTAADSTGLNYNIAVSGMTTGGAVIASIAAGKAHDTAGNGNPAASSTAVTYTTTGPTVAVVPAGGQASLTSAATINFTVTFSEPVSDFATGDVTLGGTAGATTAVVTGSGTTYNVAVSGMTHGGTVIASIAAGVAHDSLTLPNSPSTSTGNSVTYTPLGVTISTASGQSGSTNSSTISFTVVFTESVTDFATGDVTLSGTAGASHAAVTGSGTTYNVAVTGMTGPGTVVATIDSGKAHDAAGNANAAAPNSSSVSYNATAPTVTIAAASGQAAATKSSTINFAVTFSEAVTDFATGDVTLSGTAGAATAVVTGSGTTYNVAVSGMTGDGAVIATVGAGVAHDAAANANTAATSPATITYDTVGPTVTISPAAGQSDPASGSTINFAIAFSEPVSDFATADVTLSGTAAGTGTLTGAVTGSGATYTLAVSGMTASGTVVVSIAADVTHDAAGNSNFAAADDTINYTLLGVTINQAASPAQADPAGSSPVHYTVTFTEPVTDFTGSDVTIKNVQYRVTDLGAVGGAQSLGSAINANGDVAGYSVDAAGSVYTAFFYRNGAAAATSLGIPAGYKASQAYGLNDSDMVVGSAYNGTVAHAFVWTNGTAASATDLNVLAASSLPSGWVLTGAMAANDAGDIVGYATTGQTASDGTQIEHAFLYRGGKITDLGVIAVAGSTYQSSSATGINQSGQIVGYSLWKAAGSSTSQYLAFLDGGSGITDLTGALGLTNTYNITASAINSSGEVAGYYWSSNSQASFSLAYLYNGTSRQDLGNLGGTSTYAYSLNDSGEVVGDSAISSTGNTQHGFLMSGSTMIDLNSLLNISGAGWVVTDAKGINNSSLIVGAGLDAAGQQHALLLTPIVTNPQALTVAVTPVGTDGKTYDVAVSGMTGDGELVATIAKDLVHDAAGNASAASTSTDNSVAYDLTRPSVTISRASSQVATTSASKVHFTVTFSEPVTGFTASDVSFAGTVLGKLSDTVTAVQGSDRQYDVAVVGMASTGDVVLSIVAGKAADAVGNQNAASTSMNNSVHFVLGQRPSFGLTVVYPQSISAGQNATIAWSAKNVIANSTVSLCYDSDTVWNGNQHWIEIGKVSAASGYGSYTWNTTGMAPGTYYIGGYLFDGVGTFSHMTQEITILPAAKPTFRLTMPQGGTFKEGQTASIAWFVSGAPASGATVSLCYDEDTIWGNHNEHWIEIGRVAATNGYSSYAWDTASAPPGTYHLGAYLFNNGTAVYSRLAQTVTITAALTLAAPAGQQPLGAPVLVSAGQLAPVVQEAEQLLAPLYGNQAFAGISVKIADLPGTELGETVGKTIYIDRDAAGYGWFIDPTPAESSEFTRLASGVLAARSGTAAAGRADLLTAVLHELGHELGLAHAPQSDDWMNALLPLGVRRLPGSDK